MGNNGAAVAEATNSLKQSINNHNILLADEFIYTDRALRNTPGLSTKKGHALDGTSSGEAAGAGALGLVAFGGQAKAGICPNWTYIIICIHMYVNI